MINSMMTKVPLESTIMTEILPHDGNPETSRTFKTECQSNCVAMSSMWCILAVNFMCQLTKVTSFCLAESLRCVCQRKQCLVHMVIFLLFKNVWYSRAVCFYQFCFKLEEFIPRHMECYRKHSIMKPQAKLKYISHGNGKRWQKFIRRFSMFWTTIYVTRRKTWSVWSHPFKQMVDIAGSTWWSWHFEKMVWNFDWTFGFEVCCRQICAMACWLKSKYKVARSQSRTFWLCEQWWKNCEKTSLQVKRNGFTAMLLKQKTPLNPSAWEHLNLSSYCDVGRLFYGVFKLWSKLCRSLFKII